MSQQERFDRTPSQRAQTLRRFQPLINTVIAKLRSKLPREAYNGPLWLVAASNGVLSALETWEGGTGEELDAWIVQGIRETILVWVRTEKGDPTPEQVLTPQEIFDLLTPEERSVMTLHYEAGFTVQEIGGAWTPKRSPSEVRAVLGRVRRKVRAASKMRIQGGGVCG